MDKGPGPTNQNRKICWFWAETGNCKFGRSCRYEHIPKSRLLKSGQETDDREREGCKDIRPLVSSVHGVEDGKDIDQDPNSRERRNKPCRYVSMGKKCPYGEGCWFEHNIRQTPKLVVPKNWKGGMQDMSQIHTLYSLMNQMKQQSNEIKEMKQMIMNRRR